MSNNTVTLVKEIKREFRFLNLRLACMIFNLIGLAFGTVLMVSLSMAGLPLNGLLAMIFPTYGIALFVSGICIGCLTGSAVTIAFIRYSTKKVKPYVNIPKEVDELRDGLIGLGSYIAVRDNVKDTYESFNDGWKNRIRDIETNESDTEKSIKDLKQRLAKYEENDGLYMSEIRRLNLKIIERDGIIKKLLPDQTKAETEEKDAQTIKKDNRFESI